VQPLAERARVCRAGLDERAVCERVADPPARARGAIGLTIAGRFATPDEVADTARTAAGVSGASGPTSWLPPGQTAW